MFEDVIWLPASKKYFLKKLSTLFLLLGKFF